MSKSTSIFQFKDKERSEDPEDTQIFGPDADYANNSSMYNSQSPSPRYMQESQDEIEPMSESRIDFNKLINSPARSISSNRTLQALLRRKDLVENRTHTFQQQELQKQQSEEKLRLEQEKQRVMEHQEKLRKIE